MLVVLLYVSLYLLHALHIIDLEVCLGGVLFLLPLGLSTVRRIDGLTVPVYGGRHRAVGALSKFGPYTATV